MPSIIAVALPALLAVATAVWTAGGRSALERRAIDHEITLANQLPSGLVQRQLMKVAEERAALYVLRRVGRSLGRRFHILMSIMVIVLYGVFVASSVLARHAPTVVALPLAILEVVSIALSSMALFFWVSESWRDQNADVRREDVSDAHRILAAREESDVAAQNLAVGIVEAPPTK